MSRYLLSVTSSICLVAAAALAVWAMAQSATPGRSTEGVASNEPPPPTPTVAGSLDGDRASLERRLASQSPALLDGIQSVEAQDIDAVLSSFEAQELACTPDSYRGGLTPFCSSLGVAEGSVANYIREEFLVPAMRTVPQAQELLSAVLVGTTPRLELVARHKDGKYFVSFRIDPVRDPGTPNDFLAVTFRANDSGRWESFHRTYGPSSPLDTIRLEEGYGLEALYDVLWVSQELHDFEKSRSASDGK